MPFLVLDFSSSCLYPEIEVIFFKISNNYFLYILYFLSCIIYWSSGGGITVNHTAGYQGEQIECTFLPAGILHPRFFGAQMAKN